MQEFKLIIAGSRDFNLPRRLALEIHQLQLDVPELANLSIVSGMARGADKLGHEYAKHTGLTVHEFPADWDTYGKRAGFIRNAQMAEFADGLLAFWDGKSRGTQHMIETMKKLGKPVRVINY